MKASEQDETRVGGAGRKLERKKEKKRGGRYAA
jgi:hypothetical protein